MSFKWKRFFSPRGIFREFGIILTCLVCVVGLWLFIEISDEITEAETVSIDTYLLTSFREAADPGKPIGPQWGKEVARDITALGSKFVLSFVVLIVAGFLFLKRKYDQAWLIVVSSLAGVLIGVGLKMLFIRERPDIVPHFVSATSHSYPSGHTMMSSVIYLSLSAMIAHLQDLKRLKIYSISIALIVTFLVGVSRIYLGVHYPTDVLAGWAIGLAWAAFCWIIFRYLNDRFVESDT